MTVCRRINFLRHFVKSCEILRKFALMKKREAIQHIINQVGFLPHPAIFELFKSGEEIPQGLIDVECDFLKPPEPIMLLTGKGLYEKLKGILPCQQQP